MRFLLESIHAVPSWTAIKQENTFLFKLSLFPFSAFMDGLSTWLPCSFSPPASSKASKFVSPCHLTNCLTTSSIRGGVGTGDGGSFFPWMHLLRACGFTDKLATFGCAGKCCKGRRCCMVLMRWASGELGEDVTYDHLLLSQSEFSWSCNPQSKPMLPHSHWDPIHHQLLYNSYSARAFLFEVLSPEWRGGWTKLSYDSLSIWLVHSWEFFATEFLCKLYDIHLSLDPGCSTRFLCHHTFCKSRGNENNCSS